MTSDPPKTTTPSGAPAAPLDGLTFSVVGPGRVGSSLAHWLCARGAILREVVSRRLDTEALGCRSILLRAMPTDLPDLVLLSVPDQEIDGVVRALARREWSPRSVAPTVLHTSGARGADALASLEALEWSTGSLHPLRAFATSLTDPQLASETFFGFDGDSSAEALILKITAAWGADAARIPSAQRSLYHFAATLAAGGAATLVESASSLARTLGLPSEVQEGYRGLALGAIRALDRVTSDTSAAITGPVARGEASYIERLEELHRAEPRLYPLAVLTALETLRQLDGGSPGSSARKTLREDLIAICRREGFLDVLLG
ncbi:MAG: DUF2520 domain-containing protein [Thermoanaerobaculia bacterium]|nr:DUF2520 domain-containing protein [Thermoanaerobaculia bacterium]